MPRRYALAIFIACCLLLLFPSGCSPRKSGLYLSVEGKVFSNAEVFIDAKSVGHFSQMITKRNGERLLDGKSIGHFSSPNKVTAEEEYFGNLEIMSVKPGQHQILFIAKNGDRVEIDVLVPPGENYVVYSPDKEQLIWNNNLYRASIGQKIIIKSD